MRQAHQSTRIARALVAVSTLLLAGTASAKFGQLTEIATSTGFITNGVSPPGDNDRLFIAGVGGAIDIVDLSPGASNATLPRFLRMPDVLMNGPSGLLGLAFHPDYANNGKFYTYSTVANSNPMSPFDSVVREHTVSATDPNVANTTDKEILRFEQPTNQHQGGWIGFNPKLSPSDPQYLHILTGDGGTRSLAGDTSNVFGSVLRIDVDGDDFPADPNRNYAIPVDNPFASGGGAPEVAAWGLRNPYQGSFDSATGHLYIGDVGQATREEVDVLASGVLGVDFGWPRREGTLPFNGSALPGDILPLYEYAHGSGDLQGASITGGRVYRGSDADESGRYFFADNAVGRLWSLDPSDPTGTVERLDTQYTVDGNPLTNILSIGEDNNHNLYVLTTLRVYRIDSTAVYGDFDGDGDVDAADYGVWASTYGSTSDLSADGNRDGVIDSADYTVWRDNYEGSEAESVPEPAAWCIVVVAAAIGSLSQRNRMVR